MPETIRQLRMRFRDSNEAIVSFTVNPPELPVDMGDVAELMDYIISSDMFFTYTGGRVAEKLDVQLITTETETVAEF